MHYFLLLVTALLGVGQTFVKDRYTAKCSSGSFLFSGMLSFCAMCFFMTINRNWTWEAELIIPALGFGLCYAASTVFVVLAFRCGSLVKTSLIVSYSLLVPTMAGVVILRESFGITMLIGLLLVIVSVWLINYRKSTGEHSKERITLKWIIFVVIAFISNGMCSTIQKMTPYVLGEDVNQNMYMIVALGISTVSLVVASFATRETDTKMTLRFGAPASLICGILNGAVNYLVIYLNPHIAAAVLFPALSAIGLVLLFPYSILVRHEKFTATQWVGFGIGLLSVILLNL